MLTCSENYSNQICSITFKKRKNNVLLSHVSSKKKLGERLSNNNSGKLDDIIMEQVDVNTEKKIRKNLELAVSSA